MRATLVVGHSVDFIDDYGLNIAENRTTLIRGEQNVERLGRSYQNMRRALQHGATLVHQRVAGANRGADLRHEQTALARHCQDFAERHFKIFLDVVAQRLQRRDVENFSAVRKISRKRFSHQSIDAGEECGQRFAGAGGGGNERRPSRQNVRPTLLLRLRRRGEALDEPLRDERMGPG